MKNHTHTHRRAIGLLLAAAALPFTPLLAQTAETQPTAPVVIDPVPPPAAETIPAPAPVPTMEPVVNTVPSGNEPDTATSEPTTVTTSSTQRTPARARRVAPVRAAPEPVAEAPAAVSPAPAADLPAAVPEPLPAPVIAPAPDIVPPPIIDERPGVVQGLVPWLLAGLALVGALALIFRRSRRRVREEEAYRDNIYDAPATVAIEPEQAPATMAAAPEAVRPAAAAAVAPGLSTLVRTVDRPAGPVAEPEVAAAATTRSSTGRPSIELQMRPVRAGVNLHDAVVEFELTVDNKGSGAAHDVRIATWMFPAGSDQGSEAERMLIERPASAMLPEVDAGGSSRITSEVALTTADLDEDSVLPVVVAEARYKRGDGSEGRTTASFAIGVPIDGELAHFDIENPSGMHDDVEARQFGETQNA